MVSASSAHIPRVLNLRQLVVYGMIIMQVVASIPIFRLFEERSSNHSVTRVLLAMIPMLITAVS